MRNVGKRHPDRRRSHQQVDGARQDLGRPEGHQSGKLFGGKLSSFWLFGGSQV
jgi:hypothetical protein